MLLKEKKHKVCLVLFFFFPPISRRLAGFGEILSQGFSALPAGAVPALFVGVALGILVTLMEERKIKWVPSPTGTAIGMLVHSQPAPAAQRQQRDDEPSHPDPRHAAMSMHG